MTYFGLILREKEVWFLITVFGMHCRVHERCSTRESKRRTEASFVYCWWGEICLQKRNRCGGRGYPSTSRARIKGKESTGENEDHLALSYVISGRFLQCVNLFNDQIPRDLKLLNPYVLKPKCIRHVETFSVLTCTCMHHYKGLEGRQKGIIIWGRYRWEKEKHPKEIIWSASLQILEEKISKIPNKPLLEVQNSVASL